MRRFLIRSLLFCCRRLAGCTVFITGASRGIGKAIALKAAKDGANVVIAAKTTQTHPKLQGTIYTAAEESEFQRIENLLEYLFAFLLFSPSFLLSFFPTAAYGVPGPGIRSDPQLEPRKLWQPLILSPTVLGWRWNLHPGSAEIMLIPLCHSGNSMLESLIISI